MTDAGEFMISMDLFSRSRKYSKTFSILSFFIVPSSPIFVFDGVDSSFVFVKRKKPKAKERIIRVKVKNKIYLQ